MNSLTDALDEIRIYNAARACGVSVAFDCDGVFVTHGTRCVQFVVRGGKATAHLSIAERNITSPSGIEVSDDASSPESYEALCRWVAAF